jgi:predicted ATPase/DNA-binding NarL/FixJ family response regulator/transcriptional regulator with XRE-family HTH domain
MGTIGAFGALLQQYRLAAGFSQEELAERARLSRRGISDLERGQRRLPHPATVRRLADALNLTAPERAALLASPRSQPSAAPGPRGGKRRLGNLPADLTSFVGRESELASLVCDVERTRLLTLVGPGGVGKTRLALRLAARVMDSYSDGACVVELANNLDPSTVADAIATAIGIRERARVPLATRLVDALSDCRLLLVLDNCEHVLDGCAELVHLVARGCPTVTVLATSREPLRIAGEVIWPVPPLSVEAAASEEIVASEAMQLFVERARSVDPRFESTSANREPIVEICTRLEGLPLAIELAAARIRSMPLRGLLRDLQARAGGLPVLTGGPRDAPVRQRTMRATIGWSYELLSADEQALFRRLAPFRGCTLEAARSVCVAEAQGTRSTTLALRALDLDARDGLESLVNKSLLRVEEDEHGEPWYVMLETVREFALEQLDASGEAPAVSRRHTWCCLEFAEEVALQDSARQELRLSRLDRELGNFRAALDWCQAHGYAEPALRLASDLEWFWGARGHSHEGRARLEALLARFPLRMAAGTRGSVHARALLAAGRLASFQLDFAAAEQWLQRSLEVCEQLEDPASMCDALYGLGTNAQEKGDYAAARQAMERGLALCRGFAASAREVDGAMSWRLGVGLVGLGIVAAMEGNSRAALERFRQSTAYLKHIGHSTLLATSAVDMGVIASESGGFEEAREFIEDSLKLFEQLDDRRGVALALAHLGDLSAARGDVAGARTYLRRSLDVNREIEEVAGTAFVMDRFAALAAAHDSPRRALRLAGAAANLRVQADATMPAVAQVRLDSRLEPARRALGRQAVAAYNEGLALSLEAAVADAMAVAAPECGHVNATRQDPLSPRERDIAKLIARGYSNRRVAAELVIGEATVATHVQHILRKLQLASRTEVAVWAERQHVSAGGY